MFNVNAPESSVVARDHGLKYSEVPSDNVDKYNSSDVERYSREQRLHWCWMLNTADVTFMTSQSVGSVILIRGVNTIFTVSRLWIYNIFINHVTTVGGIDANVSKLAHICLFRSFSQTPLMNQYPDLTIIVIGITSPFSVEPFLLRELSPPDGYNELKHILRIDYIIWLHHLHLCMSRNYLTKFKWSY